MADFARHQIEANILVISNLSMSKNFVVGIDIGTQNTRIGVSNSLLSGESSFPKIIASGVYDSKGLKHGYVSEKEELTESLRLSKKDLEKRSGLKLRKTILAIGGAGLSSFTTTSETAVSKGDLEVTNLDIERLEEICEKNIPKSAIINKKIIHLVPLWYKLDGKTIPANPIGLKGAKLEAKFLVIVAFEKHIDDLIDSLEEIGIETKEIVASPIAAGIILLSKRDRRVGCALVDIGAETTSIVVYENNIPASLEVIPTGSNNITNDIALGLKISLEEADHIKQGGLTTTLYPRKKLEEIIEARLSDIFEAIEAHLKKIGRNGLLPAGITFCGNGSQINNLEEMAKEHLKLPARIGNLPNKNSKDNGRDLSWATVYGLCLLGLDNSESDEGVGFIIRKIGLKVKRLAKKFLP